MSGRKSGQVPFPIAKMEEGLYTSTVELRPANARSYGSQSGPSYSEKSEKGCMATSRTVPTVVLVALVTACVVIGVGAGIGIGSAIFRSSGSSSSSGAPVTGAGSSLDNASGSSAPAVTSSSRPSLAHSSQAPMVTAAPSGLALSDSVILQPYAASTASNFPVRGPHSLSPTSLWGSIKGPYPTNTWWQNLVLGDGTFTIAPFPYQMQSKPNGLVICKPVANVVQLAITTQFLQNFVAGATEGLSSRVMSAYDDLSVRVTWSAGSSGTMASTIVRGSPFVTLEYASLTPSLTTQHAIMSVNGVTTQGTLSGTKFVVSLNNGQQWAIYTSASISIAWTSSGLSATAQQASIVVRIANAPNGQASEIAILDTYKDVYPTAGTVSAVANGDTSVVSFSFTSRSMSGASNPDGLLLTALPHHVDVLPSASIVSGLSYSTIRGAAVGAVGSVWTMTEGLTTVAWSSPRSIPSDKLSAISAALTYDVGNITMTKGDTYFGGKEVAKYARLALIADETGASALATAARQKVQDRIDAFFNGAMSDNIMYDPTWGGLVTMASAGDPGSDFGFGYYNDHHFHLGYFLYAAAAVGKSNTAWLSSRAPILREFARDFANPSTVDAYYPRFRNFDWFEGHSWAAGLFAFADNRNQESTSEAINGYYGLYLLGVALNDANIRDTGRLLLALEMRSAMKYWQIPSTSQSCAAPFNSNTMVGLVWSTKANYATWFASNVEFIHCIQLLPFTPITEDYLHSSFITTEYPGLATSLTRGNPAIEMGWRG
eukprot:Opistho-2@12720